MNTTYKRAPWADMLYACDPEWWWLYQPRFAGLKVSQAEVEGVKHVPSIDRPGLSLDPNVIHQGANSGFQALNVLVLMGVKRVILLGMDMRNVGSRSHWHGDHPTGLNNPREGNFARWRENFATAIPALQAAGVEVVNCTPGSALTCFPMAHLEAAL